MHHYTGRLLVIIALLSTLTGCDGGFGGCSPAPQINSSPPTVATAGVGYRYNIDARYICSAIFTCHSVEGVQLPAGAVINNNTHTLTWTPAASQVNTDVPFVIATEPDFCGARATQSWTVRVHAQPAQPVIKSFAAARSAINPRPKDEVTVAILSTNTASDESIDFDAIQVDSTTVTFGPDRAGIAHSEGHVKDVDADGDYDFILHFNMWETGIACGDTEATLNGETYGGEAITGTVSVNTVGCDVDGDMGDP